MHRCLHIEEIVRIIASFHDGSTHATQLNLALTCKSFYEPAMDGLWAHLDEDIEPLLLLLPRYVLQRNRTGELMLVGSPRDNEWSRFRHHAKRVRSLSLWEGEPYRVSEDALQILCEVYPGPGLHPLPNLREIEYGEDICLGDVWNTLVPPSLERVSMILCGDRSTAEALLDTLLRCPSLKQFYFDMSPYTQAADKANFRSKVDILLRRLQKLTVVRAGLLSPTTIQHIASLPSLQEVELFLDEGTDYRVLLAGSKMSRVPFAALKVLHVSAPATSSRSLLTLLDVIRHAPLEAVIINFGLENEARKLPHAPAAEPAQAQYIKRVTEALSQFTSLEKIHFSPSSQHKASDTLLFDTDALTPLLRLPAITSFDLGSHPVALGCDDLEAIATAWPNVRRLELGQDCLFTSSLSIDALLPFTMACPKLEILGVCIEEDVDPLALSKRPRLGQSKSMLKKLAIGCSAIDNPSHLAAFVSGAFPSARVVEDAMRVNTAGDEELAQVNAMLPLFAKAEKLERSEALGSLRPHYGGEMQCPCTTHTVRDLLLGELKL